ncbi:MAG: aspartate/glutamate racemase family protein [Anaerolineae bacterium]|nr:aspartate/glutamate racemase family protein [Anaerolineae bacterium]
MTRLAIIHTTAATVEPLKSLASEILPGASVVNFVDDSILPQLRDNGGDVEQVAPRLLHYASFAEEVGADVILSACSSVGEVVERMRARVRAPVVRIDEAMAEAAVWRGETIGVAATLATTLAPTQRLVRAKAAEQGRAVEIKTRLIDAAYDRLMAGDPAGHDALLAEALVALAAETDVVVLAQASMARVVERLPEALRDRFLSSPRLAMEQVKAALGA